MTAISWKRAVNGDWSTQADWNPASVPGSADAVTIAVNTAAYTVTVTSAEAAKTLTLSASKATLEVAATLTMGGLLTVGAGTLQLDNGGVVDGGTIAAGGGSLAAQGGTLDGVTYRGVLALAGEEQELFVEGGLTLETAAGGQPGSIDLSGATNSFLSMLDSETLDHATLNFGAGQNDSLVTGTVDDFTDSGNTLTLGSGFTIDVSGGTDYLGASPTFGIGDTGDTLDNAGLMNISAGALNIGYGTFVNTGSVNVDGGVLNLFGTVTTAHLSGIGVSDGGELVINGELNNTGATLVVGAGSALGTLGFGTILGGTVHDSGSGLATQGGTLDGVTYRGVLALAGEEQELFVEGGLTLETAAGGQPGSIDLSGATNSFLSMLDSETLDHATLNFGAGQNDSLVTGTVDDFTDSGNTLTLGSGFTIDVSGGTDYLGASPTFGIGDTGDTLDNAGLMNISAGALNIGYGTFVNTGSVNVDGGVLNLFGTVTTAHLSGIGVSDGGELVINGELNNTGATLVVGAGSALGTLGFGTILGGTVHDSGSGLATQGGTLDGVTYRGVLALAGEEQELFVEGGLTLETAAGGQPGSIDLSGATNSFLSMLDSETLDHATLNFGAGQNDSLVTGTVDDFTDSGNTLTLGSGFTIDVSGGTDYLGASPTFGIGDTGDTLDNAGLMNISAGALNIGYGTFVNTGSVNVDGGVLNLFGTVTTAHLSGIGVSDGGELVINGELNNTGATLVVGAGSALGTLGFGTILGGTVHDSGSGLATQGGTLDGVTYRGVLALAGEEQELFVEGGLTLETAAGGQPGSIDLSGATNSFLSMLDSETLDHATLNFGAGQNDSLVTGTVDDFTDSGNTLTLGSGFTIDVSGGTDYLGASPTFGIGDTGDTLDNAGLMNISAGALNIGYGTFVNTGSVNVDGGVLNLFGTVTTAHLSGIGVSDGGELVINGELNNTGATLVVGAGSALGTLGFGTILGGTVHDSGSGLATQGGTLDGVTYRGVLALAGEEQELFVEGGLTLETAAGGQPGSIDLSGATNSFLSMLDSETLDHATLNFGAGQNDSLVTGTVDDFTDSGNTLTLGSGFTIDVSGGTDYLGASPTFGIGDTGDTLDNAGLMNISAGALNIGYGTFVNTGSVNVDGGVLAIQSSAFTNTGSITVSNSDTFTITSTKFTNFSGSTLTGGTYVVDAGSTLQFPNNAFIRTLAANLTLSGTGSVVESLNTGTSAQVPIEQTLTAIAASGALQVLDGRNYTTTKAITDAGVLEVGADTFQAAAMTIAAGGSLSVDAGGTLKLGSPLIVNGTVTNAGAINGGGATAVTFGSGTDRLILDPGATFGGTVIGGGANTTLELARGTGAGTLNALGTNFTNFGTVIVDSGATWTVDALAAVLAGTTITGDGGSSLLVLTNAGTFSLGGVSNFPTIDLAVGNNTVTVTDATLSGGTVTINDGASGNNSVSAAGDTSTSTGKVLIYNAGTGTDSFTGGFEIDTVEVAAASVGGDTLTGGSGTNTLVLTSAGSVSLGGVSKFGTIDLAAGNSTVTVTDTTLSGGPLTINDGASGNNSVSAAGDTAASKGKTLTYVTGTGTDSFAGGFENDTVEVSAAKLVGDVLAGGSGSNTLMLTSAGTFSLVEFNNFTTIDFAAGNNTVSGSAATIGGDTLTGGSGTNTLTLTSAGSANLGGVSKFATINLAAGNSTVTVTDTTLSGGTVTINDGASGNNSVSAASDTSASIGKTFTYSTGTGTDQFTGGFENDVVRVSAKAVGGDTLTGGSGANTLVLTSPGSVNLGGVSNFPTIDLAAGNSTVTVTDATLSGGTLTINDGVSGNNGVSAAGDSSASTGKVLIYNAGTGTDSFAGGFENDTVEVAAASVGGDTLTGGSGTNTLVLTSAGGVNLGGVSKFGTIELAAGSSTVTVTDTTLSGGMVGLQDGASGNNSISATGDTAASKGKTLTYVAGTGTDSFAGGLENDTVDVSAGSVGGNTLAGGSGTNTLVLTSAGSVNLRGVSKFGTIDLAAGNSTVTVTDTTLSGGTVTINDGASGNNTITAATDTAASKAKTLTYNAASGTDSFTGGFENDAVRVSAAASGGDTLTGGSGTNTLTLTSAGSVNLGGVSKFATITLATGNSTVTVTDTTLSGGTVTINDQASGNTVSAASDTAASKAKTLTYNAGSGTDSFTGGFENDKVNVSAAAVGSDTLTGGSGTNTLTLTSAGSANLGGVSKFATITLAAGNSTVTVTDTTLSGGTVTINDGASGSNSVSAAGDTSASTGKTLIYAAGTGTDSFTGGFENDTVRVSAAAVGGDTLTGGSGTNALTLTSAGTANLGGVSKFATITLAAGNSTVTVTDTTLSGGTVTINDGASGNNTVTAAGDTAASTGKTLVYGAGTGTDHFTGGFENDTVRVSAAAVGGDTLTGGSGTNTLTLITAGSANLGGVSKFSTINLAAGNSTVTVTDKTLAIGSITIKDNASGNNSVSAAGDTAASKSKTLTYYAGSGTDSFTGGFENDVVRVTAAAVGGDTLTGGSGTNTLTLTSAGSANLGGVSKFATINLATGNSTVTVTDTTLSGGTVTISDGASGNNSVSAAGDTTASKTKALNYTAGSGTDSFTGGFENDKVNVSAAAVGGDTLTGGSGTNTLTLTTAGSANLGKVSKFGTITLAAGNSTVTVTDTTLSGGTVTINDGASGNNTVSAAGDTAASTGKILIYAAGPGKDSFTGGFENDTVRVSAAAVGGDTLTGGSGTNSLTLTSAGSVNLGGVSKFATINLAAGNSAVTVTDKTLSGGTVTISDSASGGNNTVTAASDTAASTGKTLIYAAGTGADHFVGGFENDTVRVSAASVGGDTLTGGSGTNTLTLASAGSVNLGGVSKFATINLAAGNSTVTVTDKTLTGSITLKDGASGNNSVSAAGDTTASKAKTLTYTTGSGTNSFTGGFENDVIRVSAAAVGGDTLTGGSGTNTLTLITAGGANLGGVSKIGAINLAAGNSTVTVTDATLSGGTVTINDGASGNNSVSAASDTSASIGKTFTYSTGTGTDQFTGGFENDVVRVSAKAVGGDTLTGGSGANTLVLTSAGAFSLGGVSNFGTVDLAAGSNTVTVTDTTLSGGSVAVHGGASGNNSVSAASDTPASTGKTLADYLGTGTDTFTGGFENDTIVTTNVALNAADSIHGGSGANTLILSGGGTFNLGALAALTNIQTVNASEGQAAGGGVPGGVQVVDLRAGLDLTVNVATGTPNPLDPNPEVITINGAANNDVINLGGGTDTVVIGGTGETVNAGDGTALVSATAAFAGALVNGDSGTTNLKITTGGTATLNASESKLTVDLTFATNLTLSKMSFITAVGSTGNDTITALAQGQTLTGNGGKDTLNGFSGFGDVFSDTSAHLNTTTIGNFGGSDLIDLTDMNPNLIQPLTYNTNTETLTATDGTHTANIKFIGSYTLNDFQIGGSDGHTGSLIKFA